MGADINSSDEDQGYNKKSTSNAAWAGTDVCEHKAARKLPDHGHRPETRSPGAALIGEVASGAWPKFYRRRDQRGVRGDGEAANGKHGTSFH